MTTTEYKNLMRARQERLDDIALELGVWHLLTGEHVDIAYENAETDELILQILEKGGENHTDTNKQL